VRHSPVGIAWTAVAAVVMLALAAGKARTGAASDNPVLRTEGRVTLVDGLLAASVLVGLTLNATLGWWWADPVAAYVLVYYAARETWGSSPIRSLRKGDCTGWPQGRTARAGSWHNDLRSVPCSRCASSPAPCARDRRAAANLGSDSPCGAMGVSVGRASRIGVGDFSGIDVLDQYATARGGRLETVANVGEEQFTVGRRHLHHRL
jgi:hypothetical protein